MIPEISEKQFHQQLAEAISDLIAKRLNIYPKQALNLFEKSRVYKDLMNSDDEFDQMMPADFLICGKMRVQSVYQLVRPILLTDY